MDFYGFYKYKESGKLKQTILVSSILQWRLIWGSIVVLIATFIAPLINHIVFKNKLSLTIQFRKYN